MEIAKRLLSEAGGGEEVVDVRVGLHWTAVSLRTEGEIRTGLASTLSEECDQRGEPEVPEAGSLEKVRAEDLARWVLSGRSLRRSIGMAALNALLPRYPDRWSDENAEKVIARLGRGKRVVIVGRFPFIPRIRPLAAELFVLEKRLRPGTHPEEEAPALIPRADVVAITSMTLLNGTLEELLRLRSPGAATLLLGPTTPLSPTLFECGIDYLSGSIVEEREAVLRAVGQGANFRQVHRSGVRLVTMEKGMG